MTTRYHWWYHWHILVGHVAWCGLFSVMSFVDLLVGSTQYIMINDQSEKLHYSIICYLLHCFNISSKHSEFHHHCSSPANQSGHIDLLSSIFLQTHAEWIWTFFSSCLMPIGYLRSVLQDQQSSQASSLFYLCAFHFKPCKFCFQWSFKLVWLVWDGVS